MKNKMKLRAVSAALCMALMSTSASALDLLHAYEAALSNDPEFRSAVKDNEAGQANRIIGRSALMPRVVGTYNQYANDSTVSGPIVTNGPSQTVNKSYPSDLLQFQLTQPLFNLAALAQMRQANAQADLSDAKFLYNSQDLLVRVLQAYTDVLYAQDNLKFLESQRDAYREQLKVNQRMFDKGEGTLTDALETRASYELSEAQVIEARDVLENNKRKLEALIGETLKSDSEVKKLSTNFRVFPLVPGAFEIWKDTAIANNAELRASNHNVEVARQEYEKQKAAHYPVVAGVVGWNQQRSQNYSAINQNALTTQAGVQITMPIFSGGETVGRSSQSRAIFEKAMADRDAIRERVITELRKQYDAVKSSVARVEALNRAVDSARELTRAMRKSVQGGQRINLDVLLSDKALSTAQRDLAQAKYGYMIAFVKLKQYSGELTVNDMEKIAMNFLKDTPATKTQ